MARDPYLQTLVEIIERADPGSAVSITLTVHGFLVSGMLVSERAWREGFATYLGHTPEAPEGQAMAGVFQAITDAFDDLPAELKPGAIVDFIHLRDAQFFSSSSNLLPQSYRAFWRGSFDSVDGFFFGALQTVLVERDELEDEFDDDFDD